MMIAESGCSELIDDMNMGVGDDCKMAHNSKIYRYYVSSFVIFAIEIL